MNSHCHVSLGGSCCLSFIELLVCTDLVKELLEPNVIIELDNSTGRCVDGDKFIIRIVQLVV